MDSPETHIGEERLEQYALGRAVDSADVPVGYSEIEQHLLICEACRERLEFLAAWDTSIRRALLDRVK